MSDHPNARLIRWALDTIRSGDAESVMEIWADDIEWHTFSRPEPIRTKAGMFASLAADSPIESDWVIHDVIGNDDHVIALTTDTATRDGETIEFRVARIYHVRDGKVTARWEFSDDTRRIVEFLSGPSRSADSG